MSGPRGTLHRRPARTWPGRTVAAVTSPHAHRWIRLDGTTNMRDLGGLPTADGGRTTGGRILRSDNLQTLTDADVRRLVGELGLRQVVDLSLIHI